MLHLAQVLTVAILVPLLFSVNGCEWNPERDNPADPGSDLFENTGIVTVSTVDYQGSPVNNAVVRVSANSNGWVTNDDGEVDIVLDAGQYILFAEKEGYTADPDTISISAMNSISESITLHAVPVIDSVKVVFCRSYSALNVVYVDVNQILVSVWVQDEDETEGQLDAKFLDPISNQQYVMSYVNENLYQGLIDFGQNGYSDIAARVNRPFVVTVADADDHEATKSEVMYQVFQYNGLYAAFVLGGGPIGVKADSVELLWDAMTGFTFWPTFCYVEIFDEDSQNYNEDSDLFLDTLFYNNDATNVYFEGLDLSEYSNEVFSWRLSLMDAYGNIYRSAARDVAIVAN